MNYTSQELFEKNDTGRINSIDIANLAEYYQNYLMPFNYSYETSEGRITLRFDPNNFCHLISLEKIIKGYNLRKSENYKGNIGWENALNGNISINELKNNNKAGFKSNKFKYTFFNSIPSLVEQPTAIIFDRSKLSKDTNTDCEILFYNNEISSRHLHLGINKNENTGFYVPTTFLINTDNSFTDNQKEIILLDKKRIITL